MQLSNVQNALLSPMVADQANQVLLH